MKHLITAAFIAAASTASAQTAEQQPVTVPNNFAANTLLICGPAGAAVGAAATATGIGIAPAVVAVVMCGIFVGEVRAGNVATIRKR